MANNFNFEFISNVLDTGYSGLRYRDANGHSVTLPSVYLESTMMMGYIAPYWKKQAYEANTLVIHFGELFYNSEALPSENWNASHWTKTTIAEYIKHMTT